MKVIGSINPKAVKIQEAPILGQVCYVVGRENDGLWMGIYRTGHKETFVELASFNRTGHVEAFPYGTWVVPVKGAFVVGHEGGA